MSVNYPVALRTTRLQDVAAAIDAAPLAGVLRLLDPANNVLSSLTLAKPATSVSNGIMTFLGLSLVDPAAAASGIATGARIEDGGGNTVISGLTVAPVVGTGDIILSPSNTIVAGQTVAIQAATITGN